MPRENRTFAVIGLGAFGSTIATELARFGNQVIGVDTDEKRIAQLAAQLPATVILDATDETALREAGIDGYDVALVAIGRDIESSILTTMNLKLLGVGTIWVKASSRTHHRILSKLGADRVILPEQEMGRHAAQMLNNPVVNDYVSLGNTYSVVNIVVPKRVAGRQVAQLGIGTTHELDYLGLMRGTEYHKPTKTDLVLEEDDRLLVLGRRPDLVRFGDSL
jgi:trk system potassium uptake protein TrkA